MGLKAEDEAWQNVGITQAVIVSWERKRAQEVVAYISNKLIGIHLTPDEARTVYNRLVASTHPDDGTMKWPPEPKTVEVRHLGTQRRIKE